MSSDALFVTWWPDAPHLDGNPQLVDTIERAVARRAEQVHGVTATGPFVRVAIDSLPGVLAACDAAGIALTIIGDLPDELTSLLGDVPPDAVA